MKRYEVDVKLHWDNEGVIYGASAVTREDSSGGWVQWSDVEALLRGYQRRMANMAVDIEDECGIYEK